MKNGGVSVKKNICMFVAALLFASALSGCQKTPNEDIVIGKNNEAMIEKAQETAAPEEAGLPLREKTLAPEALQYERTEGKVTVRMHAAVTVPEGGELSILRVKAGGFSQEQVSALWRELVGDTEMFYLSQEMTKSEIETSIIAARASLERADNEDRTAYLQFLIDYFERIYAEAPEERGRTPVDGTLRPLYMTEYGSDKKTPYVGVQAESADGVMRFAVQNPYEDENGARGAGFEFHRSLDMMSEGQPKVERYEVALNDDTVPERAGNLALSPRAAAQKVSAFFFDTGLPFAPAVATLDVKDGEVYYSFYCTRIVGDIPSAFILGSSYKEESEAGYAAGWAYELFSVTVDDAGIKSVRWEAPIDIAESVVGNSALMPFSDIQEIFGRMMFVTYEYQAQGIKTLACDVSDVKLETMRVVEQYAEKMGLLIPVWNFYGTRTFTYEDGTSDSTSKIPLLTINAIDGSIIDRGLGY